MKIKEVITHLERLAPLAFQEDYDNSGLICGNPDIECSGILVSLDCTEEVVLEAAEKGYNLLITHHPLIFRPIRSITVQHGTGRALVAAIKADLTIYAIHTNLDNIKSGVNATIADKLGLSDRKILLPAGEIPDVGSGLLGTLNKAMTETQFLEQIKQAFGTPVIRHSPLRGKPVSRVALCGGSGSFLISNALQAGADFFISADIKYHDFFSGEAQMVIADIGHFESEQFTVDLLLSVILKKFPNFAVLKSGKVTNPVNYYL